MKTSDIFPADCILLRGVILADEASLTGESTPARKFAVGTDDRRILMTHGNVDVVEDVNAQRVRLVARLPEKAHFLYAGARAVSAEPGMNRETDSCGWDVDNFAEAIVVRTGGWTYRGRLMRERGAGMDQDGPPRFEASRAFLQALALDVTLIYASVAWSVVMSSHAL